MILTNQESEKFKKLMIRQKFTIAVAESLTSGNIQASIGSISGASDFFEGGITAYNLERKVSLLGINRIHAQSVNCVSARVANEMAQGICEKFDSVIGIATTGYAETPTFKAEFEGSHAYFAIWNNSLTSANLVKSGLVRKIGYDLIVKQLDCNQQFFLGNNIVNQVDASSFQFSASERVKMQFQVSRVALLSLIEYLESVCK